MTQRIAYLGPRGTFSEAAVEALFSGGFEGVACRDPGAALAAVGREADFALIPVENNTGGAVGHALELLDATELAVKAEVALHVEHALMGRTPPGRAVRVLAHPQALEQCRGFLERHPGLERVPVSSNAEGARRAAIEEGSLALGPAAAAAIYGLEVYEEGVQDSFGNATRFLLFGREDDAPSIPREPLFWKTTLVTTVDDRPGALWRMLEPFARLGLQMTRIESRPAGNGRFSYRFFIDVVGEAESDPLAGALSEMRSLAPGDGALRVFGSYPVFG